MNNIRLFKSELLLFISIRRLSSVLANSKQNEKVYNFQRYINKNYSCHEHFKQVKHISNFSSMQKRDNDSSFNEKNSRKHTQEVLEDDDFQNILKDFAKDFGVDSSTDEVLDDIRKNIDEEYAVDRTKLKDHKVCHNSVNTALNQKYKEFSEEDAVVIPSHEETGNFYHVDQELAPRSSYDLKRGMTGVFDVEELVDILRKEGLLDITAISVPPELHYTDYLVLVTAKSERHCQAVGEFIIKLYKQKKNKSDPFIIVEGGKVPNWKAIDMGNIVLHIFLEETRYLYDIESLWLVESEFDSGGNIQEDPMLKIIEEQMSFFSSMHKNESDSSKKDS